MCRLLPLVASLAVLGCDAGVAGTYELMSIDGQELPYTFELFGTVTITSLTLTLRDSTYELATKSADGDSWGEGGTFRLSESNTICFTSLYSWPPPPPAPPAPGASIAPHWVPPTTALTDTVSSPATPPDPRADRLEPESRTDCVATWDGDQIIMSDDEDTLVFRR